MSGFSFASRGDAGLEPAPGPRSIKGRIELEARLVLEENHPVLALRFFLISGNVLSSHRCCAARSARERSLRGRCTLNPSRCKSSGTYFQLYETPKRSRMSSVIMRAVQTPEPNPADKGPLSMMLVSSDISASANRARAPGAFDGCNAGSPRWAYAAIHLNTAERSTWSSPAMVAADRPSMYSATALARCHVFKSPVLRARSATRWIRARAPAPFRFGERMCLRSDMRQNGTR